MDDISLGSSLEVKTKTLKVQQQERTEVSDQAKQANSPFLCFFCFSLIFGGLDDACQQF